jgi:aldose 1-epimerase
MSARASLRSAGFFLPAQSGAEHRMIRLQAGPLTCDIEPELGGCVAGLWHAGVPVLRSTPAERLSTARQSGCYALVPFSNRIAHAKLQWQGTLYPLVRNNGEEPHAIHGVGWQRPWTWLDGNERFALLSYEHRPDGSWPFAFDASQSFRLGPDALELTLSLTNQSQQPAPVGLGWHPFFVKREGARLAFDASGRWEMGADKLPTQRAPSLGIHAEVARLDVDHCFDGWDGRAVLRDGQFEIRLSSSLSLLVVFTTPSQGSIAIEPVSHVNNALALVAQGADASQLGLVTLDPGGSLTAEMTLAVERLA